MARAGLSAGLAVASRRQIGLEFLVVALLLGFIALVSTRFVNWSFLISLDFGVIWNFKGTLLRGLLITIALTLSTMVVATLAGILLAAVSQVWFKPVRWLVAGAVEVFRNIPILITLFWIHFGVPLLTGISLHVMVSGMLAMILQATAFMTVVMKAGIAAVPRGQGEAARALGLSTFTRWRYVIIPQALRIMLPTITNVLTSMLKASAILSALSVEQLWQVAQQIGSFAFKPIEALTAAALIYFVIGKAMTSVMSRIETKMNYPA